MIEMLNGKVSYAMRAGKDIVTGALPQEIALKLCESNRATKSDLDGYDIEVCGYHFRTIKDDEVKKNGRKAKSQRSGTRI